ncbi:MAG: MFS transporter [Burkholderiales bacterium]|nr:MFS transporter [Opitutaceae bacterium]
MNAPASPTSAAPALSAASPSTYKWELLTLLWFAGFLNQGDRQIFNAILPRIRDSLGATDVQMGLVAALFTAFFGVLVPVAGWLGDRVSRKRLVCVSLLVFSAGTLLTGFSGGLISLIIFRSVATGAGESFFTPPALSLIGQHHTTTRSLALSIYQTSQYVGVAVSSWVAAWLAERFGWRTAFYVFGGFGLVLMGVLMLRLKNDQPPVSATSTGTSASASAPHRPASGAFGELLRIPSFLLLTAAFGCMVFTMTGFMTWMPTLLATKFQLSLSAAAFQAVFVHLLFAFVGVLLGGWWTDRRARTRPITRFQLGAVGLVFGAPFVVLLARADTLPLVYVGLAGFGFFRGLYDANIFAALYEVVAVHRRATATGVMVCFAFVTGATAQLILGYLKQTMGLDRALVWLAPSFFVGGLLIAFAAFRFFNRDREAALALSPS